MKVIAQLNPFTRQIQEFDVEQVPIQDIIQKLDPYHAVNTGWRVLINDKIISDFSIIPQKNDIIYIKLVPEGDGSPKSTGTGMKIGGWGMIIGGALAFLIPGVGTMLGMAMIGTGIGMAANGQILMDLKMPKIPSMKDRESPQQDPSIQGSQNQSRPMSYIPILLGRRKITMDLATKTYTWVNEAGEQFLYQLFCLGQKDQVIETNTFKIEETLIKDFSGSGDLSRVLNGSDPLIEIKVAQGEAEPPILKNCVHEIQIGKMIKHQTQEGQNGAIIRTTPDKTQEIHVDIFFHSGLGKYNDEGEIVETSVEVAAYYKGADQGDASYQLLGYFSGSSNSISGKELKTKRFCIHKKNLPAKSYTVKIERISADSKDNKVVDAVYLGSIRAIKNEFPVSSELCKKLSLVAVKIKTSEKLNNVIDKLNVISCSKLPCWTGSAWEYQKTSNPASAALFAMQGNFAQQKLADSEIDLEAFKKLYTWCHEKKYECNQYVSESMTISQLLDGIANTCRSKIFRMNGKITVIQDVEKPSAVQLFTPRNSFKYTESITICDIPDAIALQFVDADAGFVNNELKVYNTPNGNKAKEIVTCQDSQLWGVTNSIQARKLGMYKYAVMKNRPVVHKFSCDFEYMLCNKGDRIRYAGDIALAGISQGRIVSTQTDIHGYVRGFTTDEDMPMEKGQKYAVRIRNNEGKISLHEIHYSTEKRQVNLIQQVESQVIQGGNLFSFGRLNNDSVELLVTDIQMGEDFTADITAVEYRPEIFDVDNPDFILPDYVPHISDVYNPLDAGNINITDWSTWYTYNDSKKTPAKPRADGSTDGWHRVATEKALWISVKTAKDIYSGEWSNPVPTGSMAIEEFLGGGIYVGNPDIPSHISAKAQEDGIVINFSPLLPGLKNTIRKFVIALNKGKKDQWTEMETTTTPFTYFFDRKVDAYPEYEILSTWKIKVKSVNIYDKQSNFSSEVVVNTDIYGTWKVQSPHVYTRGNDRTITLLFAQPPRSDSRKIYGSIRYGIVIRRPDIDKDATTWFTPGDSLNPFPEIKQGKLHDNELNYKKSTKTPIYRQETYTQTMPLQGQGSKNIKDTVYMFKVFAENEAGKSADTSVTVTALSTNIMDIVNANATQKEIYVPDLSAISSNMGVIKQGSFNGSDNNFWSLSTITTGDKKYYEGEMRVGGKNQFFHVKPVINDLEQIVDYEIVFKVGKFEISSTSSKVDGEIIIMDEKRPWERTRISPQGTCYEFKPSEKEGWHIVAKQETSGLLTQLAYSDKSLSVINSTITDRRKRKLDIGIPYLSENSLVYHFDTNLLDQNSSSPAQYTKDGDISLVDDANNRDEIAIDFTPAILALAPYSEVGKSAYGQFTLSHPLKTGTSNTFTVDFWIQYIWSENQVLFDIGNEGDKIQLACLSAEPHYNDPLKNEVPYNTEITLTDRLTYNVSLGQRDVLKHYGLREEVFPIGDMGVRLKGNSWYHMGIVLTPTQILFFTDDKKKDFNRFNSSASEGIAVFNSEKKSFMLDELLIDSSTAISFEQFTKNSQQKIPWAALTKDEKHYILDTDNSDNVRGNIFSSKIFRESVEKILKEKGVGQ